MKPPPKEILDVMNHIVNCPGARNLAIMELLLNVQGFLSLPNEHTEQVVAAAEHDREMMAKESHAKTVCLYKAVTASAQTFRDAIRARLIEAGMPAADLPAWV